MSLVFLLVNTTEQRDFINNLFSRELLIIEAQGLVTADTKVSQNTTKHTNRALPSDQHYWDCRIILSTFAVNPCLLLKYINSFT